MSQIPCKQLIRIEMTGWFKHYFPGNLRRNFLVTVCNYTSYQNLQKTSLPNPKQIILSELTLIHLIMFIFLPDFNKYSLVETEGSTILDSC